MDLTQNTALISKGKGMCPPTGMGFEWFKTDHEKDHYFSLSKMFMNFKIKRIGAKSIPSSLSSSDSSSSSSPSSSSPPFASSSSSSSSSSSDSSSHSCVSKIRIQCSIVAISKYFWQKIFATEHSYVTLRVWTAVYVKFYHSLKSVDIILFTTEQLKAKRKKGNTLKYTNLFAIYTDRDK